MLTKQKKILPLLLVFAFLLSTPTLHAAEAPPSSPPLLPQSHSQKTFDPYTEDLKKDMAQLKANSPLPPAAPLGYQEIVCGLQAGHMENMGTVHFKCVKGFFIPLPKIELPQESEVLF